MEGEMITKLVQDIEEGIRKLQKAVNDASATSGDIKHKLFIAAKLIDAGKALQTQDARFDNVMLVMDEIASRIAITSTAENVYSEHLAMLAPFPGTDGFHNEVSAEKLEELLHVAFKSLGEYIIHLLAHDIAQPDWKGSAVQLELTGGQAWNLIELFLNGCVLVNTTHSAPAVAVDGSRNAPGEKT
jgi:hypothetical protein